MIRPIWPAFTLNGVAAQRMRDHYGTHSIESVQSWPLLLRQWPKIQRRYRNQANRPITTTTKPRKQA